MESVVVTGGNGYIGSHMCRYLFERGYDVHVVDNHSTSPDSKVHNYAVFHNIDIGNSERMKKLLTDIKPTTIYHFAARAAVSESQADPLLYLNENLVKTVSLLDSAINTGVNKFIFSSTCATFGVPLEKQINEHHPQKPINTYGLTKLLMEKVMRDLAEKNLMNILVLRYFNAAGCSPDGVIGENHDPEYHLIPNLCLSHLSGGSTPFNLYGEKFDTPDGTCVRDYIHVCDLVEAHYKGAEYLSKNLGFHDFNLGSETGYSVRDVISAFNEITKSELEVQIKDPRPGDPASLVADSQKSRELLGFKPKYSLHDCIEHTLAFLSSK
jgi:UDP-glucose 4-epimerase